MAVDIPKYVEIKVYGLTYGEFLTIHGLNRGGGSLQTYLKFGGLPYLKHLPLDDTVVFDYLRNVSDAISLKDIVFPVRYPKRCLCATDMPFPGK